MLLTLRPLFFTVTLFVSFGLNATETPPQACKPHQGRIIWHDQIDREQKNVLKADGKADEQFVSNRDEDINYIATKAVTSRVDNLQSLIECDTAIKSQVKVRYLQGIERMLKNFLTSYRSRKIPGSHLPNLIEAYEKAFLLDKADESIYQVIEKNTYEIGVILLATDAFKANSGVGASKNVLVLKYGILHPDKILYSLKNNPHVPFRDSMILVAAYNDPKQLYDYAAANNELGRSIRRIDDPLVKAVSKMATSGGSGQFYFPFLDNIMKGKITFEEIDAVKTDEAKYFRLLVKTRIDYVNRAQEKQKVFESEALYKWLASRAKDHFIKKINALHNEPDAVRFKVLQPLSPEELYYLIVTSESEVYTSSYTKGLYPLLMHKIDQRGDSILKLVGFDRFKKFIKMAAGFNTLSHFLGTFPKTGEAELLMTAFVSGLEKSDGLDGLEDGVDVADSYASIRETIQPIAAEMLKNIKSNYDKNVAANNKNGMVIYNILYKLFLSADTTQKIDLTAEIGIPPVYSINYSNLLSDSSKQAIMSMYFFGDKDGRDDYNDFVQQFTNSNWKRTETKQWVVFSSVKGKPVSIYANKWFDEETNEDEKAQEAMTTHLTQKGIDATIVVHRGHSYYAESTIEHIQSTAKVVFLGSCGGYHLIHDVLNHSSDAHIIASKQIGKRVINRVFLELITDKLRNGQNIDWIPFWAEFDQKSGKIDGFDDYIPPHKNLGALFIKAYKNQTTQTEG